MNRKQFIARFDEIFRHHGGSCDNDNHVLWEAEKMYSPRLHCKWFVCTKPLALKYDDGTKGKYWDWVNSTLKGRITCFSSDSINQEEWWGGENKKDMTFWLLKWSK